MKRALLFLSAVVVAVASGVVLETGRLPFWQWMAGVILLLAAHALLRAAIRGKGE